MNIIKKYWDFVYIYVLLFIPCSCICAGIFWTICKLAGLYPNLSWFKIGLFDFSQLLYLSIALFFIWKNHKNSSYIPEHLNYVKFYIVSILFIQYNFILYLFPSIHVWECTFLFWAIIVFLFDFKLMALNIIFYMISLLTAHLLKPQDFLPFSQSNLEEIIAFRAVILLLTALCILLIVYFVEGFLMQAKESDEENIHLMEKQLNYYRNTELLDTELRKFRHDMRNHFICMESLLNKGEQAQLQKYFLELQQDFSFQEKICFSGNPIVDAILHYNLSHYCEEGVRVTIYGELPKQKTMSDMDLCTLFSNLLSNSINAANQCSKRTEAQLIIHFQTGKKYFSISISNSAQPDMETKHSVKKMKRKDRNHGYGMSKIQNVIEKYDGSMEQIIDDELITITVYLPI